MLRNSGACFAPPDQPHFFSQKYRHMVAADARRSGAFPYDVPYLSKHEVTDLVHLSKPFGFTTAAFEGLRAQLPADVYDALRPLALKTNFTAFDRTYRFWEGEFWQAVDGLIGQPARLTHQAAIHAAATKGKQSTPQWTAERAAAHLQTTDLLRRRASVHPVLWQQWRAAELAGQPLTEEALRRAIERLRIQETLTPPAWFVTGLTVAEKPQAAALWTQRLMECGVNLPKVHARLKELYAAQ